MAEAAPSEERQQLLRKVIPNETVLALRHTSDLQGVLQTLFTVGTLVVGASLVFLSRGNLLALLVLGFFVSFLFMPLHECVHRTAFKSTFANDSVAFVTGVLTLRPPVHYKRYHNAHHRFTGDPDKDPELSDSWVDPSLKTFPSYCLYLSGLMFWIDRVMTVVKHACGIVQEFYLSSFHDEIVSEARLFLGIYFCLGCLGLTNPGVARVLMLYWIIPSFLGQPFLRFYLIAEHNGCKQGVDMMGNTRTTLTHW
jgi:fatty acid desaturase